MQSEVLGPAVKGTLNILQACSANNVRKVVVVSSTSAVYFNPNWPRGKPKDESCWSDRNLCLKNEVSLLGHWVAVSNRSSPGHHKAHVWRWKSNLLFLDRCTQLIFEFFTSSNDFWVFYINYIWVINSCY